MLIWKGVPLRHLCAGVHECEFLSPLTSLRHAELTVFILKPARAHTGPKKCLRRAQSIASVYVSGSTVSDLILRVPVCRQRTASCAATDYNFRKAATPAVRYGRIRWYVRFVRQSGSVIVGACLSSFAEHCDCSVDDAIARTATEDEEAAAESLAKMLTCPALTMVR